LWLAWLAVHWTPHRNIHPEQCSAYVEDSKDIQFSLGRNAGVSDRPSSSLMQTPTGTNLSTFFSWIIQNEKLPDKQQGLKIQTNFMENEIGE